MISSRSVTDSASSENANSAAFYQRLGNLISSKVIPSLVGVQQGDPAGPMTFSLAIQPIIDELKSELNVFYLDDGTLSDDHEIVLSDFMNLIDRTSLPIRSGGLGIRIVTDIALPAFLASTFGIHDLVDLICPLLDEGTVHLEEEGEKIWNELNPSNIPTISIYQRNWDIINIQRIIVNTFTFDSFKGFTTSGVWCLVASDPIIKYWNFDG
ncbi:hypothetical protein ILUMI_13917 [Ignelater luminosus]|uniref:Reverse transcriptase domain-containing protein n=1 Tax=Ignelater luminosus TaxID=2038154 RepID=A0A8K0CZR8_IGNLU|nr:hypothetical protein ILUMI_13917 [Ignelater luminosus]